MKIRETNLRQATNDDNADRAPIIRAFLDNAAPWVDNFAGAGGASLGISMLMEELVGVGVLGVRTIGPDIAINHSPEALALHAANHPETRHIISDVFEVDPVRTCKGRRPLLAWFSPTCTFFSRAKGDPLDEEAIKVRGLCWVATRWAASKVRPRVICMENVVEFQKFGPLHKDHTHGCSARWAKRHAKRQKNGKIKPCCKKKCHFMKPIKAKEGTLYKAFINKLRKYYKYVETAVMTACDYGAPTSRKRWFLIASDYPVSFPAPTHGPGLLPYRTAAECIDWSIPCPSIFDRDRDLKPKTLARIVAGAHKFVLDAARPFIVPAAYGRDVDRSSSLDEPMRTVCGNRGGHALVTPYLVSRSYGERPGQDPRTASVEDPYHTVVSGGIKHGLTLPVLIKNNGGTNDERVARGGGGGTIAQRADEPMHTLATHNTKSLALVYGVKARGTSDAHVAASGFDVDTPLTTVSTGGDRGGVHHGIAAASVIRYNGQRDGEARGQGLDEPITTLDTSNRFALQAAYLVRYNGTGSAESVAKPAGSLTTKERFGLTTVTLSRELTAKAMRVAKFLGYDKPLVLVLDGEEWVLVDIGFRMLTPRELYRCQGFPDSYVIDPIFRGKPLSKTAQIKGVGNSVPPIMAKVIGRAALAPIFETRVQAAA